jgi:predicted HNH restriction endonuclease
MNRQRPETTATQIRSALRRLWLRSRERAAALKAADYRCAQCGVKQSRAKGRRVRVDVHHIKRVDWEGLIELVRDRLLVPPKELRALCQKCHKEIHRKLERVE